MTGVSERLLVEGKDGRRRLLRIVARRREGRYMVLVLAPQRRRCYRAGCLCLAEVPAVYCPLHQKGEA